MKKDAIGDKDLFSENSYGFKQSTKWLFIIIGILTIIGIIYEITCLVQKMINPPGRSMCDY